MENVTPDCPCAGDWTEIEARFHRAQDAMLQAQQRYCEATHAFLAAHAEVQQMLEAIFPEPGLPNQREKDMRRKI